MKITLGNFSIKKFHAFDHYKNTFPVLPLSPSFDILLRSKKCVPITVSPTVSLSLNCILILWHNGGNISVKTICSFHTGLYEFFFTEVFPYFSKRLKMSQALFRKSFCCNLVRHFERHFLRSFKTRRTKTCLLNRYIPNKFMGLFKFDKCRNVIF